MDWQNIIRNPILPKVALLNNSINFKYNRETVLNKYKYICRYCGGIYHKYMYCIKINNNNDNNPIIMKKKPTIINTTDQQEDVSIKFNNNEEDNIEICCKICYKLTHLNLPNNAFDIKLYWSDKNQLDIIRLTVDSIIKNNKIPLPQDIDYNIKIPPISLFEFINILNKNNNVVPSFLSNCKLFISKKLDITFIIANYAIKSLFIDDSLEESSTRSKIDIPKFILNNDDVEILNNIFDY